jgi:hypothetical protein
MGTVTVSSPLSVMDSSLSVMDSSLSVSYPVLLGRLAIRVIHCCASLTAFSLMAFAIMEPLF